MSTYITAIAAGPYAEATSEHDGIPLGIYCRQSLARYLDADEIFDITRRGFDYFHLGSACAIRSANTTSSSRRSTSQARWRTSARSVSSRRTTSSARG